METHFALLAICERYPSVIGGFPSPSTINGALWCFVVEQVVELLVMSVMAIFSDVREIELSTLQIYLHGLSVLLVDGRDFPYPWCSHMNILVNYVLSMNLLRCCFLSADTILSASCPKPFKLPIATPLVISRFMSPFVHIYTVYGALWSYISPRIMSSVVKTNWNKVYSILVYCILPYFTCPVVFDLVNDLTPDRNQAKSWIKVHLQCLSSLNVLWVFGMPIL